MVYGIYMVCTRCVYPPCALRSMYGIWVCGKECDRFITRKHPLHIDSYIIIYYTPHTTHHTPHTTYPHFQITKKDKNSKDHKKRSLKEFYPLTKYICIY